MKKKAQRKEKVMKTNNYKGKQRILIFVVKQKKGNQKPRL